MQIKRNNRKDQKIEVSTKVIPDRQANSNERISELETRLATLEQMLSGMPVNVVTSDMKNDCAIDHINEMGGSGSMADDIAQWLEQNSMRAWKVSSLRHK